MLRQYEPRERNAFEDVEIGEKKLTATVGGVKSVRRRKEKGKKRTGKRLQGPHERRRWNGTNNEVALQPPRRLRNAKTAKLNQRC